MTKRQLIESLSRLPDNANITVKNLNSNTWSNICFISYKNSADRLYLNFEEGK